jgi:hypothetical protein
MHTEYSYISFVSGFRCLVSWIAGGGRTRVGDGLGGRDGPAYVAAYVRVSRGAIDGVTEGGLNAR